MSVPSYDDLTPGIPGVIDAGTVGQLALFLEECQRRVPEFQGPALNSQAPSSGSQAPAPGVCGPRSTSQHERGTLDDGDLYACLRLDAAIDGLSAPDADEALMGVSRDFSPRVMRTGDGEVVLDVAGLGRLIGPPDEIERQLAQALLAAGRAARVAIAATPTAARLLAAGGGRDLAGLPIHLLRPLEALPPGLGHRDRARPYETLERWGLATLGELAALPAADLSSRLGRRGVALQRLARGLDAAPFVPDGETPRYIGRLELEWPIDALEPLSFVFARLLDPLSLALERADRGAAAVRLDLRLTGRATHTRRLQLPAPMRDPRVLRTLLLLDLESHPPPAAVDIVAIELDPAPARITQFSLLRRALPSPETLSTLTARLSALVGEARVGSPALLDSHRPDAFAMAPYAPDAPAAAPRHDAAPVAVLRRRRAPIALRVGVEHGRPVRVAASRRGIPCGAVVDAAGPWRVSGGWWTGQAWNRSEWDVALSGGAVCRIFQDRALDRWFLDGIYD